MSTPSYVKIHPFTLVDEATGSAYRLEDWPSGRCLACVPVLADGTLGQDWGEVEDPNDPSVERIYAALKLLARDTKGHVFEVSLNSDPGSSAAYQFCAVCHQPRSEH